MLTALSVRKNRPYASFCLIVGVKKAFDSSRLIASRLFSY